MSPPNSSKTTRTTCGWRGFCAAASLPCEQPHSNIPANSTATKARTQRNLASGEEPTAQMGRQALAAPAHDHVVVVLENRAGHGCEPVHPRLGGLDIPVVGHGRHALLLEQAPFARSAELAGGHAGHAARRVEVAHFELELEVVRDAATPGDQVALVRREHPDPLHSAPPLRPPLGLPERVPDLFAGALQEPSGEKGIPTLRGSPS